MATERQVGKGVPVSSEPKPVRPPSAKSTGRNDSDAAFIAGLAVIAGTYVLLLVGLVVADVAYISQPLPSHDGEVLGFTDHVLRAFADKDIQYSIRLTLVSCFFTAIASVLIAAPTGYLLSRFRFRFHSLVDAILDIPIVLPPLVVGLSLLIMFQFAPARLRESVVYGIPAVIIAQVTVSAAFAVRVMRATFDQLDPRLEQVALTLGCSRYEAFFRVVLPQATGGLLTAATLAWARALGEFGPLLIFAGATRGKTEVLSTTVYLEFSIGNLSGAVVVSLLMVAAAVIVLLIARWLGPKGVGTGIR